MDELTRKLAETEGQDLGPAALALYSVGMPADQVIALIPETEWWHLALGLLSNEGGIPVGGLVGDEDRIEALLNALIEAGFDINTVQGGFKLDKPDFESNLLGYVALDLRPRLVRFLLSRGAYPDLDRASALYWTTEELESSIRQDGAAKAQDYRYRARAIVSALLRAGLSPSLLHPAQVKLLFAGRGIWALLPFPVSAWRKLRLPTETQIIFHGAQAGLGAVLPPALVRYVAQAL